MKLLLDTHAFIWWDNDKSRLSGKALTACLNSANHRFLGVASVWELQIKLQLGKLTLRLPLIEILRDQQSNGLIIEPVAVPEVLGLGDLPPIHRDPFDRLLVAQLRRGGFQFVSNDPPIAQYDVPVFW